MTDEKTLRSSLAQQLQFPILILQLELPKKIRCLFQPLLRKLHREGHLIAFLWQRLFKRL